MGTEEEDVHAQSGQNETMMSSKNAAAADDEHDTFYTTTASRFTPADPLWP